MACARSTRAPADQSPPIAYNYDVHDCLAAPHRVVAFNIVAAIEINLFATHTVHNTRACCAPIAIQFNRPAAMQLPGPRCGVRRTTTTMSCGAREWIAEVLTKH